MVQNPCLQWVNYDCLWKGWFLVINFLVEIKIILYYTNVFCILSLQQQINKKNTRVCNNKLKFCRDLSSEGGLKSWRGRAAGAPMASLLSTTLLWTLEFYMVNDLITYQGLEIPQVNNSSAATDSKYYKIKQKKWK